MFWTDYSSQIFLFGAELTKAVAQQRAPAATTRPKERFSKA